VTGRMRAYLPALAWAALIIALSSRPSLPVSLESGSDKIAHFLAYAVFGWLIARAFAFAGIHALAAVAVGVLFGATDEWHQSFVPGRSAEVGDWVADSLGIVTGVSLYHWMLRRGWRPVRPAPEARTDSFLP
jgi:VanZ family protein